MDYQYNKISAMNSVKEDPNTFKNLENILRKDKDITLIAVTSSWNALQYADDSMKKDKDVVFAAVSKYGDALKFADDSFKKDKTIVLTALMNGSYASWYVDKSLLNDKEVVTNVLESFSKQFNDEHTNQHQHNVLEHLGGDFKKDKNIIRLINNFSAQSLHYADDILRKDKDFVLSLIENASYDYIFLKYVDVNLKKDKEVVLSAVSRNGSDLRYADETLKSDKEVVLAAINSLGSDARDILECVNDSLKYDKDIIRMLQSTGNVHLIFENINANLINDKEYLLDFILEYINNNVSLFSKVPLSIQEDKKFVIAVIETISPLDTAYIIENIDSKFFSDKEIILPLIKKTPYIHEKNLISKINDKLKHDKEVILFMIENFDTHINIDTSLKDDKEINEAISKSNQERDYHDNYQSDYKLGNNYFDFGNSFANDPQDYDEHGEIGWWAD